MKICIIVSDYYKEVSDNLLKGASQILMNQSIYYDISKAPGSFEIPYLIIQNIFLDNGKHIILHM